MSDQPPESHGRYRSARAPRLGDSRAPVATVVVLAVAVVAVIVGFVVLGSITDPVAPSDQAADDITATTIAAIPETTAGLLPTTTTTATTTTTTPSASRSDAVVVVANASGIDGSATAMTSALAAVGYTMAPVANSTAPRLEQSIIYYLESDPAAVGVARLLGEQIPTAQILPMPQPPPLDRPLDRATVAVMLGRDAAGRPLAQPPAG